MKIRLQLPERIDTDVSRAVGEFTQGILQGLASLLPEDQRMVKSGEFNFMFEQPPSRYRLISAEVKLCFPRKDAGPISATAYIETTDVSDGLVDRAANSFRQEVLEMLNAMSDAATST